MKWCLGAYEKIQDDEMQLLWEDGQTVNMKSFVERKTYKTLDNFILMTETTRFSNNNVLAHSIKVFEDVPSYIDSQLFNSFVEKHGLNNVKEFSDDSGEFMELFKPESRFLMTEFDLTVEKFIEVERELSQLDGKFSYKILSFPSSINDDVNEIYLRHKYAVDKNMGYNLDLACLFAKARIDKLTNESVNEFKKVFAKEGQKQDESSGGRSVTLRVVIKKE